MINAPEIAGSTAEERRAFIKTKYPCIADCDMCGLCKVFRGKDAEHAYADYISGKRTYLCGCIGGLQTEMKQTGNF